MEPSEAGETCDRVLDTVAEAVVADRQLLENVLCGVLARGHVLLEDVPGTGKTLTARCFADALGLSFSRIQFTPDLLPSDITGSHVFNEASNEFEFSPGPIFENVVLADEINRAPPKTQAAMLEAMGETQVSVNGETNALPDPFFVIATQNPIEQEGTFGLPATQRDRFIFKLSLGYPGPGGERTMIDRRAERRDQEPSVSAVADLGTVRELQAVPEEVDVDDRLRDYVVTLGQETRADDRVDVGVSPRGIQRLFEAARASAVLDGRSYVVPDDVRRLVGPTFAHRLVLTTEASVSDVDATEVVDDLLDRLAVPAVEEAT